jgi:predicted nucleic-acid-binding Zn-ribbon protein
VFSIHPRYIELFKDVSIMRIQKDILDKKTIKALDVMEKHFNAFFKTVTCENTLPKSYHYTEFYLNKILEDNIDRASILDLMIYKMLFVSLDHDKSHSLFTSCRVFLHTVIDTIIMKKYYEMIEKMDQTQNSIDYEMKKVTLFNDINKMFYIEHLIELSEILKEPETLKKKMLPKIKIYI